jgi:hypothetical protein
MRLITWGLPRFAETETYATTARLLGRISRPRSVCTLLAAAAVLALATGTAVAAPVPVHSAGKPTATFGRLSPGGALQIASAHCAPKLGDFNRTAACAGDAANIDVYDDENGDLVGSFSFEMHQGIHLQVKKTDFIEYDEVTQFVPLAGTVPAISMEFDASCSKPCHATTHFPQGALLAVGVKGTVSYTDAVSKGHVDETHPNYVLNLTSVGYTLVSSDGPPFIYPFPIDFRCDDTLPGQGAGCVFPRYTPTIRTMTTLPDIAKNIAKAQRGPGKYGKPGSKHPLHRLVNKAQQTKNHNEVCGKKVRGTPPKGKSCDEYPFQSTEEGGTKLSKENRSWTWVPTHQQDSQGGILRKFYYENRVLNKDAFWVKV